MTEPHAPYNLDQEKDGKGKEHRRLLSSPKTSKRKALRVKTGRAPGGVYLSARIKVSEKKLLENMVKDQRREFMARGFDYKSNKNLLLRAAILILADKEYEEFFDVVTLKALELKSGEII